MPVVLNRGDSSDRLVVKEKNGMLFDTMWTCKCIVVSAAVRRRDELSSILITKNMILCDEKNKFHTTLTPSETDTLVPGDYVIAFQLENNALNFRRELSDTLRVKPDMVPNS